MPQVAVFDAQAVANSKVDQQTPPTFTSKVWKSDWVDVKAYRRLEVVVRMSEAFATNGVVLEQSVKTTPSADADADWWDASGTEGTTISTNPITAATNYHVAISCERVGLYARLVVKHAGTTDPTTFRARLGGAGIT